MSKATDTQVGGTHYKDFVIQPAVFCELNGLSHLESNVVKRMCRWRTKGVALKDLRKAQHEIELLIEIHGVEDWPKEDEAQPCTHPEGTTQCNWCGLGMKEDE